MLTGRFTSWRPARGTARPARALNIASVSGPPPTEVSPERKTPDAAHRAFVLKRGVGQGSERDVVFHVVEPARCRARSGSTRARCRFRRGLRRVTAVVHLRQADAVATDAANLQLFRLSVRERQKLMLAAALKSLESTVLTARSATNEESRLRKDEAELMLQWVERAKQVEPSGQVMIAQAVQRDELLLENGDILRVPKQDGLVLVNGEVIFPNAIAHDPKLDLQDYIKRAGGYSQSADTSRVIVAHRDGSFEEAGGGGGWDFFGMNNTQTTIKQGDEILVLPKVKTKSIEVARGITQIIYQIAIAAKVILDL